ncbi:hypothetical protein SDC9_203131 [bioreactor metagenome]|uniref:Uncharacterized protein n=1 Tax=bioreactor metagenome TaxID=1076179 RepID=A0A645IYC8_9ZZZZ
MHFSPRSRRLNTFGFGGIQLDATGFRGGSGDGDPHVSIPARKRQKLFGGTAHCVAHEEGEPSRVQTGQMRGKFIGERDHFKREALALRASFHRQNHRNAQVQPAGEGINGELCAGNGE